MKRFMRRLRIELEDTSLSSVRPRTGGPTTIVIAAGRHRRTLRTHPSNKGPVCRCPYWTESRTYRADLSADSRTLDRIGLSLGRLVGVRLRTIADTGHE
jgi:hypothetical protein